MTDPNPKQQYGDRKVKLQLVPPAACIAIAKGMAEGAEKYGPWNWRDDPVELMTYIGAVKRHIDAWIEGEEHDPDSKGTKHHLDGAMASLAIVIDAMGLGEGRFIDNRPKNGNPGTLERLQQGSRQQAVVAVDELELHGCGCEVRGGDTKWCEEHGRDWDRPGYQPIRDAMRNTGNLCNGEW